MKLATILVLSLVYLSLPSCKSFQVASTKGRPNSGGNLKLEKTYDLVVTTDPRLMKSRDIKFLSYAYRDYSFSQFLTDALVKSDVPLSCDMLDLVIGDKKSLINLVESNTVAANFRVFASDIACESL